MKCSRAEGLFSAALDGTLSARAERELSGHLGQCEGCSDAYRDLQAGLVALRAGGTRTTAPELRAAILDAVDRAARADVEEAERTFERARSGASERAHPGWRIATHAAAAVFGLAAGWFLFRASAMTTRGYAQTAQVGSPAFEAATAPQVPTGSDAAPAPDQVQVPEQVIVEVERIVEVPRLVEVERIVTRGPWFTIDARPLLPALAKLGSRLGQASAAMRDNLARRTEGPKGEAAAGESEVAARLPERTPPERSSTVSWRRIGGRMSLEMRGPLHEIVPILLAKLESEDEEVAALVERRLDSIRAEVASDPSLGPRLRDPEAAAGRSEARGSRTEDWNAWWAANAQVISGSPFESSL